MDVCRPSPSGRALWILLLAGLWMISIRRRSNPDEREGGESTNRKVRPCNLNTCIHGSCTSNDLCICYYGFKGPTCNEVLSCSSKTCIYGVCTLNDTCTCNHGFKGPTCNEVAFCTSNTCIHGSCLPSGTCSCNSEFTGPSCNEALSYEEPAWTVYVMVFIPLSVLCISSCCGKDTCSAAEAEQDRMKESSGTAKNCCCLCQNGEAETKSATARVSGNIAVISTGK
ncbi:uncharacterized protein LOC144807916 isoform X2 [Lissotriton helveticus]